MSELLAVGTFDGLIFDCDGTLVDTAPAHLAALKIALARVGLDMDDAWYFERVGLTPDDLLDQYEDHFSKLPIARPDLLAPYSVAFQGSLDEMREVQVVANMARAWRGRVPMCVASNGQRANVQASLNAVGLLPLFDFVVTVEDVERGKPAPDIFLEGARRMKVEPARCMVLEDSDEGLEAARRAGMPSIDVRTIWTPSWKASRQS
jgi:beta-phosphoglucomutase-like phosphatase (HAD superfamily)